MMWLTGVAACGPEQPRADGPAPLRLASTAFAAGGAIPERYTCLGAGLAPPLTWSTPPAGTRSLVLRFVKETPPSGETVLWLVFNLSPATAGLPAHGNASVPAGGRVGVNDLGTAGYDGPCPSVEGAGRYVFRLVAIDRMLPPEAGRSARHLAEAMAGHILAEGELAGTYTYRAEAEPP